MNLKIGQTYYQESDELAGVNNFELLGDKTKFIKVKLFLLGYCELNDYSNIESVLENFCHDNLEYGFLEVQDDQSSSSFFCLRVSKCCGSIYGFRNHYGIGLNWKLYLNSKSDVVVQHKLFPENNTTVRFRNFPLDCTFYIYLSCLIYTLTNYEIQTSTDLNLIFDNVCKIVANESEIFRRG